MTTFSGVGERNKSSHIVWSLCASCERRLNWCNMFHGNKTKKQKERKKSHTHTVNEWEKFFVVTLITKANQEKRRNNNPNLLLSFGLHSLSPFQLWITVSWLNRWLVIRDQNSDERRFWSDPGISFYLQSPFRHEDYMFCYVCDLIFPLIPSC